MFGHDHHVPRVPQSTSFDGVKLSFLVVRKDHCLLCSLRLSRVHIFVFSSSSPLKNLFFFKKKNSCSRVSCQRTLRQSTESPRISSNTSKIEKNVQSENKAQEIQDLNKEIKEIKEELEMLKSKLEQKRSTLLKADFFLRYTLLHATSGDPKVMVRRIMQTSDSDSGAVTGLETWRQMSSHFAGSAKTRTVSLLKQIMSPVEWNAEKSKDVNQQCYRWLELISKYEAVNSEKISQTLSRSPSLFRISMETLLNPSMSASAILHHGLKFTHFWSITSTMQFP